MKIVRSKRKTLCIHIDPHGEIILRAPMGMSDEAVLRFAEEKRGWIESKSALVRSRAQAFSEFYAFKKVLIRGAVYEIKETPNIRTAKIKQGYVAVPLGKPQAALAAVRRYGEEFLRVRIDEICRQSGLTYSNLMIRSYKSKWGLCRQDGSISLNWRLIMLPDSLIDYVIYHELCHRIHMDHSQKLWSILNKYYPNSNICRKNIKNYSNFCNYP